MNSFLAKTPSVHYHFREFTMNPLLFSRIHWIHYLSSGITMIYIYFSISLFFLELTICFAESLWILYRSRVFTFKTLSFPRIHYKFTISYVNSLWNYYLFCKNDIDPLYLSWTNYEFTMFVVISITISCNHSEFTINFENLLWLHSFMRIHYKLTIFVVKSTIIFVANKLWIHFLLHESTINHLLFSRKYFLKVIISANSL